MVRIHCCLVLISISLLIAHVGYSAERNGAVDDRIEAARGDWPWWRGPNRNGVADADQRPPLKWSVTENVVWKAPVPGRGHGSATVWGNRVLIAAAEEEAEVESVLCLDRESGRELWKTVVHSGGFEKKSNAKSTHASSTPACDGKLVFINFLNNRAVYVTALNLAGEQVWQTKLTDFVNHQGFGASPALYQSLVIVSGDNKGGGAIAALDRASGKVVWRHDRPKTPNYSSPIILHVGGRDQLLFTGCDLVSSFEPLTGKPLWEIDGSTTECVTSIVTDGERVFTSGGYPKNHMSAVRADGSGKVEWENTVRVYVPSLLVRDGYLYGVTDAGVATCWKSDTGEEVWQNRLGGTFSSSPILVGENIFVTNETGVTFIFNANPKEFALVAENQLGDEVFATPTICGSRIYQRVAFQNNGRREEMLYCLGASE